MGSSLPSVANGKPYQIVGYMDSVSDFSTVVDPADVRRCEVCHDQKSGAAQASFLMTKPTRAACGSCHDDVNFATGTKHVGGFQPDDNQCATCHSPKGERPFDSSILGAHVVASDTALAYPQNPNSLITGVAIHITGVRNTSAGQKPIVEFTIKDTKGNSLALSKLEDLSFVLAGPTTDHGYTSFGSNVTTPGYVSEDGNVATCDGTSHCTFTFQHAIPAKATGTYAIATESERLEDILTGTNLAQTVESGTANQVVYFSVDGSPVLNRRTVVEKANCNGCHVALTGHGARRNDPEFCILCHNPSLTDAATRAQSKNPVDLKTPPQALNFNLMIHKIHTGANLAAMGASYLEISHNGRHRDFSGVLYPVMGPNGSSGDTGKCYLCHVNGSEQNLPTGMNVVAQPQGMFNPMPAVTSACLSCHVTKPAASHAIANTNSMGESCEVCHDAYGEFAVDKVHAQ
jgi:OmcA/MtrC family decaheme c-type cytochrome